MEDLDTNIRNILENLNEYKQMNLFYTAPEEVDIGDEYEIPLNSLVMTRDSIFGSLEDIRNGRISRSQGVLDVWFTEDKEFYLTDGYHRVVEYLMSDKKEVRVKVEGVGYSPYWRIPPENERFIYNNSLKYNGLENLWEKGLLDEIYNILREEGRI